MDLLQNRNRLTDSEKELMVTRGGRDSRGVWDRHVQNAKFKLDNKQGPTV